MHVSHRAETGCSICEKFASKVTFQRHKIIMETLFV